MLKNITMTGAEMKITDLYAGIDDQLNPDWNGEGNAQAYGAWAKDIQINFYSDQNNADRIYISENSGDPIDKMVWLYPGQGMTMDYRAGIKAMNTFYATGNAGDILFITCR